MKQEYLWSLNNLDIACGETSNFEPSTKQLCAAIKTNFSQVKRNFENPRNRITEANIDFGARHKIKKKKEKTAKQLDKQQRKSVEALRRKYTK